MRVRHATCMCTILEIILIKSLKIRENLDLQKFCTIVFRASLIFMNGPPSTNNALQDSSITTYPSDIHVFAMKNKHSNPGFVNSLNCTPNLHCTSGLKSIHNHQTWAVYKICV